MMKLGRLLVRRQLQAAAVQREHPGCVTTACSFRVSGIFLWYSTLALKGSGEPQRSVTRLSGHVGQ